MIKKTNAAIQKKVMNLKGIKDLILALGYVDVISISFYLHNQIDEEHYVFIGDYFLILISGSHKIEDSLSKLQVKRLSPAERKKYELMQVQK